MDAPSPDYSHLLSMSGPYGTYEHADLTAARVEHGYCTDDVARVLLVVAREPVPDDEVLNLARSSLDFLRASQSEDGTSRNRRSPSGHWFGESTSDDCWGRSVWALGTTIARIFDPDIRAGAFQLFERAVTVRSPHPRAMAFATFGAAEVLYVDPEHRGARELVADAARLLDRPEIAKRWFWPEDRLTYANAALPEALIVAGHTLGDGRLLDRGLKQLKWLVDLESPNGFLSVVPVGGRAIDEKVGKFDQQPIEVAAMSDACIRAHEITGDAMWVLALELAVRWFLGNNDAASPMYDPVTGGGYDGLTPYGPNRNEGAESTIALLTTLQHARRFVHVNR